ncbi:MAG: UDP-N-acetylmuramoyl-L-alanine--D-glutamate ligase [Rickettsiales bacterium]|jgi:UDP-N-acetylmuramoylalanine--D-glutamate ligase|nr:UDP-N-acetylmuramoyl-L-alanine--D-glutamate ligase [Rickettsiales bacterium]
MINNLLNKTIAILGLGKSGMSVLKALKQRGVHVIAWDDKEELRREAAATGARVADLRLENFGGIEYLVISPGIAHTYPEPHPVAAKAKAAGTPIIDDLELFVSTYTDANYIGITGTNGKSTTVALIYHILKENGISAEIGGNFGVPVFDLPELGADGWYVLELSSYQIELTPSLDLDIAALLNITPDHLARHNGMQGYIAVKKQIFRRKTKAEGTNIVATDDANTRKIYKELLASSPKKIKNIAVSSHSHTDGIHVSAKGMLIEKDREIADLKQLENLRGRHNWQNIATAFAATRAAGLPAGKIVKAIASFKPLDHRQQYIGNFAGITFINDSKATDAEAVLPALETFREIYWIIGGRAKEGGIKSLLPIVPKRVSRAFAIGECEKQFYGDVKSLVPSKRCGRLDKAVMKAFKYALKDLKKGKVKNPVILLSPATASWDQYKCFEDRGLHFAQIFEKIKEKYKNKC